MGAAGVAVFSTDGGFVFLGFHWVIRGASVIRDLGLSSSGRGRKARMGSGPRRGESVRHDRARRQDCWVNFPDCENVSRAVVPASLTFLLS